MAYRVVLDAGLLRCKTVGEVAKFLATLPANIHVAIIDEVEGCEFTPKDFLAEAIHANGWDKQREIYKVCFHSGMDYLQQQKEINGI